MQPNGFGGTGAWAANYASQPFYNPEGARIEAEEESGYNANIGEYGYGYNGAFGDNNSPVPLGDQGFY